MGENTKITWASKTWNPILGCTPATITLPNGTVKPHPGCKNCYAQTYFKRFGVVGKRRKTSAANWRNPVKWNREAGCHCWGDAEVGFAPCEWCQGGRLPMIVFPSLCDPFEEWDGPVVDAKGRRLATKPSTPATSNAMTMSDLRRDMFDLYDRLDNLILCLLTKRPENIREMWTERSDKGDANFPDRVSLDPDYRDNVWLMYSASDQESLEAGLPHLLECRDLAPVIGLSLEPLVGPIHIPPEILRLLGWVLVGGESGADARPCQLEWILDIVRQCEEAGVPCFVKQVGANPVTNQQWDNVTCVMSEQIIDDDEAPAMVIVQHPKGGDPAEWPEPLRVQQYPGVPTNDSTLRPEHKRLRREKTRLGGKEDQAVITRKIVAQWCPDCDCMRLCDAVGEFLIECRICLEPIQMSADNGRLLRKEQERENERARQIGRRGA